MSKKFGVEEWLRGYQRDVEAIADLDLSPHEEKAIEALNARIRVLDKTWGDSVNDETSVLRVVLAARRVNDPANILALLDEEACKNEERAVGYHQAALDLETEALNKHNNEVLAAQFVSMNIPNYKPPEQVAYFRYQEQFFNGVAFGLRQAIKALIGHNGG